MVRILCHSEITAEGRRITKLDQILLNGNNIAIVSEIQWFFYSLCLSSLVLFSSLWNVFPLSLIQRMNFNIPNILS